MLISISTRHGQVSDETQERIKQKLQKLPRWYDRVTAIELTIDLERRDAPSVDLRVSAKKREFVATGQATELFAAIDAVMEKMEQQLRKHKEKLEDRHRGSGNR